MTIQVGIRSLLGLGALFTGAAMANADTKVVSDLTISRSDSSTDPVKHVTTYFKGEKVRVEFSTGEVTIYDLSAKRVYLVKPADKTYQSHTLRDFLAESANAAGVSQPIGKSSSPMKTDVKVELTKDKVVQSREIVGRQSVLYTLTEDMSTRPDTAGSEAPRRSGSGNGRSGGRRGGGSFPGGTLQVSNGGGQRTPGGQSGGACSDIRFEGGIWMAENIAISANIRHGLLPYLASVVFSEPALNSLSDRLSKQKGFPVSLQIMTTHRDTRNDALIGIATTVKCEVTSISEELLSDSLFAIPADYSIGAAL